MSTNYEVPHCATTAKDVNLRIQKARGVIAIMSNIWRANYLNIKTKLRIFNACVKSVLLYGCETWYVTRNIERKLQTFINICLEINIENTVAKNN
jgi:hypothetical protein